MWINTFRYISMGLSYFVSTTLWSLDIVASSNQHSFYERLTSHPLPLTHTQTFTVCHAIVKQDVEWCHCHDVYINEKCSNLLRVTHCQCLRSAPEKVNFTLRTVSTPFGRSLAKAVAPSPHEALVDTGTDLIHYHNVH